VPYEGGGKESWAWTGVERKEKLDINIRKKQQIQRGEKNLPGRKKAGGKKICRGKINANIQPLCKSRRPEAEGLSDYRKKNEASKKKNTSNEKAGMPQKENKSPTTTPWSHSRDSLHPCMQTTKRKQPLG